MRIRNQSIIISEAIEYLLKKFGPLETEVFISSLSRDPFDYTKWRRDNLYKDAPLHELNKKAARYAKEHHVRKRQP